MKLYYNIFFYYYIIILNFETIFYFILGSIQNNNGKNIIVYMSCVKYNCISCMKISKKAITNNLSMRINFLLFLNDSRMQNSKCTGQNESSGRPAVTAASQSFAAIGRGDEHQAWPWQREETRTKTVAWFRTQVSSHFAKLSKKIFVSINNWKNNLDILFSHKY